MADKESIMEIILKAKDLASEIVKKLQENLQQLPAAADRVNEAFKTLKILPTADLEAQKAKIIAAYNEIKNSGVASAAEIASAEAAKNKAIADLERDNFAERKSLLTSFKEHWMAVSAAIVAGWMVISKAADWAKIGATALQAEESFRNVTTAYGVEGDKLLAKMKEVSVGAIDESALMQRAVKALQQGLNPDQIVSLLEVARSSARIAGIDIASAFDRITEATANQMPRGLKSLGIVIDQNKAYEDFALKLDIAKDALTEQQKSEALADAAIVEGLRQRANMNISLINEAEQLQINKARFDELKESIGKGFVTALGIGTKNIDAIGVAFAAAAIMNAPTVIKAIIASFQSLTVAAGTASVAMKSSFVGLAAFIGYELGGVIDKLVYKIANIDLSGLNRPIEDAEKGMAQLNRQNAVLNERLAELGFTGPDAWNKYNLAMKTGILVTDQATGKQTNLLETIKQTISIMAAQVQTLQATSQYEIELIKKDFEEGKITMDQYLAFVKNWQTKITDAQIAAAQKRIEEAKKEYQMKTITEDEMKARIAVINEQITQIRLKAIQDQQHAYDAANKETLEKAQKTQEEEFNSWKNLQELKLNALKRGLDLEDAMDQAVLQRGEMQQSEYLERKLERIKTAYEAEIQFAENVVKKIQAENDAKITLTDQDLAIYQKAIDEKEKLQNELQITIIKSEQDIADEKERQAQKASKAVVKTVQEEQKVITELTSKNLNEMVAIVDARTRNMWTSVSSFLVDSFDDIKQYFGGVSKALAYNVDDMTKEVSVFLRSINSGSYNLFWNAALFGRKMVDTIGISIYDWARRVSDYIQYVKGLMQSLREQIMSYQDQLDQMRGNEVAIIERWYQVELQKLKDQYAKELLNTEEYQKALTLLEELYREKRKQAAEQEAEEKARLLEQAKEEAESGASGDGGGLSLAPASAFENFAQQLQDNIIQSLNIPALAFETPAVPGGETTLKKETNVNASYVIYTFDQETSRRWIGDVLFPEFMRLLKLRGIDL